MAEDDYHRRVPTLRHTSDWTDAPPGDYQLPTEAFVPDVVTRAHYHPTTFLSPRTTHMQAVRNCILRGWKLDQDDAAAYPSAEYL